MLWLALAGNAVCAKAAPSLFVDNNRPAVRNFVTSAYAVYANAIKQQGVAGLQKVVGPNFTLRLEGNTYQDKEAFAALEQSLMGLQDGVFYVNIPKVTLTKTTAVALTAETVGRKLDADTTGTTTRYWTQTWRKTAQGWKLAASEQRSPEIKGPSPIMTHTFGSSPKTLLTINMTGLGTDLGTPPAARAVRELYDPYLSALKRHNEAAFLSLLTPGFTRTYEGKTDSHSQSLKQTREFLGLFASSPDYRLTIDRLFVKPAKATVYVEEGISMAIPDQQPKSHIHITGVSGTYAWVQHWVKTAQGWRLDNITRTIS